MRFSQDLEDEYTTQPVKEPMSWGVKIGLAIVGVLLLTRVLRPASRLQTVKELERKWRKK